MTIALSILFDSAYIEPALVTAFDAISLGIGDNVHKIYLIYLRKDGESDREAASLIQAFADKFSGHVPVVAVSVANTLGELQSHHFNNSIIYKGLIPSIISSEPFILNLDAGILFGGLFKAFLQKIEKDFCQPSQDWIVAAHGRSAEGALPSALAGYPHHSFYSDGNLLLFNVENYVKHKWHERYIRNYSVYVPHLEYAEQELICLTAADNELLTLPGVELRRMEFLNSDVLLGRKKQETAALDDCLVFKFVGSFKPWKYWVLDPSKSVYTKRRSRLEAVFPLAGNQLIEAVRMSYAREEYVTGFLKAYDYYLQQN